MPHPSQASHSCTDAVMTSKTSPSPWQMGHFCSAGSGTRRCSASRVKHTNLIVNLHLQSPQVNLSLRFIATINLGKFISALIPHVGQGTYNIVSELVLKPEIICNIVILSSSRYNVVVAAPRSASSEGAPRRGVAERR